MVNIPLVTGSSFDYHFLRYTHLGIMKKIYMSLIIKYKLNSGGHVNLVLLLQKGH